MKSTTRIEVLLADVFAGVDVDRDERFGLVDDDRPARWKRHPALQGVLDLRLDAEGLEERLGAAGELEPVDERRGNGGKEIRQPRVGLLIVDPDRFEVAGDEVPNRAQSEVELAVERRGGRRAVRLAEDPVGELGQVAAVGRELHTRAALRRGSRDEPAVCRQHLQDPSQPFALLFVGDPPRDPDLADAGQIDESASGQR